MITIFFLVLAIRSCVKFGLWAYFVFSRTTTSKGIQNAQISILNDFNLVVLVKIFKEKDRAADLVARMISLADFDKRISVIIVGTEREREMGVNPSVLICQRAAGEDSRVVIIEAPETELNNRSFQMNFALETIGFEPEKTWILHADVDTDFDEQAIGETIAFIQEGGGILQIPSLFVKSFESLSYIQKGHAFYQSRWTFAHEILRLSLYQSWRAVLVHIVGHGVCIRLDILQAYGGWPTTLGTEDIHLGYIFGLHGEDIHLANRYELSETPRSAKAGFAQELAWSQGALNYLLYGQHLPTIGREHRIAGYAKNFLYFIQGVILWLNWMNSSWIILAGIFYAFLGNHPAALFITIYMLDLFFSSVFVCKISGRKIGYAVSCFPSVIFFTLRRSFSANIGMTMRLLGNNFSRYKTEL